VSVSCPRHGCPSSPSPSQADDRAKVGYASSLLQLGLSN
jgi:hypothetical protein